MSYTHAQKVTCFYVELMKEYVENKSMLGWCDMQHVYINGNS
jgi:hypothetical protein